MIYKNHYTLTFFGFYLIIMGSLISCDPGYEIEWKVKNNSDDSITIFSKTRDFNIERDDTLIPTASVLLLEEYDFGVVRSHIKYMEITIPPFEDLIILNSIGDSLQKDVYLIDNWNIKNINDEIVEYTLEIFEDEF